MGFVRHRLAKICDARSPYLRCSVTRAYGYSEISAHAPHYCMLGRWRLWMTGNVFFIIIPNQKKVVASLKQGKTRPGTRGQTAFYPQ